MFVGRLWRVHVRDILHVFVMRVSLLLRQDCKTRRKFSWEWKWGTLSNWLLCYTSSDATAFEHCSRLPLTRLLISCKQVTFWFCMPRKGKEKEQSSWMKCSVQPRWEIRWAFGDVILGICMYCKDTSVVQITIEHVLVSNANINYTLID